MKKKNKINKNILLVLAMVLLVLISFALLQLKSVPVAQQNRNVNLSRSEFVSKDLHFSISVPSYFEIKSSNTGVDLISKGANIEIVRNGTQFSDVNDYLEEFDKKRNIQVDSLEQVTIDGHDGVTRIEKRQVGGELKNPKVYYIFANNAVYIISTDSSDLFSDLDQIAQSFKYNP